MPPKGKRAYSINNLEQYAPFICAYSLAVFVAWNAYFVLHAPTNVCTDVSLCPAYTGGDADRSDVLWSKIAAAAFGFSSIAQLPYLLAPKQSSVLKSPIFCSVSVNAIASLSHLAMALDLCPVLMSPFGRVSHVARFGEWVALVPLLVVMIHSLDIRDEFDVNYLFISSFLQQISVLCGAVASFIADTRLSLALFTLSFTLYSLIFYDMYRAAARFEEYRRLKKKDPGNVDKKLNHEGIIKSFYLTLCCCVCWTFVVLTHALGVCNLLSHKTEFMLQSIGDVVIKLFYVYILSAGQISVMNEEKLLGAISDIGSFFGRMKYMTSRG